MSARVGVAEQVSRHATLVVGALLSTLVAVRILAVAHYDVPTALAVLRETDTTSIITGVLVSVLLPWLAGSLFLLAFLAWLIRYRGTPKEFGAGLVTVLLALVSAMVLPIAVLAIFAVLLSINTWREIKGVASDSTEYRPWEVASMFVIAGTILVVTVLTPRPWLPSERITVTGQARPVIGYALNRTNDELVVLVHRTRAILRYPVASIQSRRLCRVKQTFTLGLVGGALLLPTPDLPTC
jgi:hypothetical protein